MTNPKEGIESLMKLLESGVFDQDQQFVLRRLIYATENGSQRQLADYIGTMDEAAKLWAINYGQILQTLA